MSSFEDLKKRDIESLKKSYDQIAKTTSLGLSFYREEIARRENEEFNSRIKSMTSQMRNMTIFITILTVINVGVVIYDVFKDV
jgi:hypothetical protein